jgi:hypothetical protein
MKAPVLFLTTHRLSRLKRQIDAAGAVTPPLMVEILNATFPNAGRGPTTENAIHSFIRNSAWTDAALALIAFALPRWRLRRIGNEGRQWWCALERGPPMGWAEPEVDESHENMTLALLKAFITALSRELEGRTAAKLSTRGRAKPRVDARAVRNDFGRRIGKARLPKVA